MSDVIISKKNEIDLHLDCEQAILYELQEEFSFDVEGASFSPAYRKKYWDGKIRLVSVTTQTCPAGMVYRLCKWLDRHGYTWEFKDNKFYGVPYETDEMITPEGVEFFMKKISGFRTTRVSGGNSSCCPEGIPQDYRIPHGIW